MSNMTTKGQVTIPKRIRDAAGLKPGRPVNVQLNAEGCVVLSAPRRPVTKSEVRKGIEKVRGTLKLGMSTDEFMALLRGD
ncbi:MAG TPA: AbrB/MazE/SpoVT family DNA-binding domain-containing protein [Rhizomicrobium sp.]|jgi:AbrB family looped-hinge helix DNA binding protein|nr:AbrB/MazE/SpoVT family DNA-binding domain-containing protein [Rhizomicrobium sp.]